MPDFPAFPRLGLGDYGPVAPGSSRLARPAVLTAGFGGRYSQRTGDGINALPRDFAFRSPKLRADQIEARPRQFICPEWTTDYADRCKSTLTAKFEENFDP
jgi:hypothetical protein